MAILATSMVVLLENHASSIRLSQRSRQVSVAINLAKDLMTELELEGFPEIGANNGNFEEEYPGLYPDYRWEREVQENNFWDYVRECYVRVFWQENGQDQMVQLTEYVAAMDEEQRGIAESQADDDAGGASPTPSPGAGGTGG